MNINPTAFYVSVLDVWSNASFIGPFESATDAGRHLETINPNFDRHIVDGQSVIKNIAEFGPADIVRP